MNKIDLIKGIAKELYDSEEAYGEINAVATDSEYEDVAERIVNKFFIHIVCGMKKPFTEQEEEIMNLLVEAHNKFVEMEQMHPDDMREWVDGIHKCQNVLKGRVVTRDYPDIFYNSAVGK